MKIIAILVNNAFKTVQQRAKDKGGVEACAAEAAEEAPAEAEAPAAE